MPGLVASSTAFEVTGGVSIGGMLSVQSSLEEDRSPIRTGQTPRDARGAWHAGDGPHPAARIDKRWQ